MIQIQKAIINREGAIVARGSLPLLFDYEDQAVVFMGHFLTLSFPEGKSGYINDGDYWWGCQGDSDCHVHQYRLQY